MNAAQKYLELQKELLNKHPHVKPWIEELATSVVDPRTATQNEIWEKIWEKPLFANTKVDIGAKWKEQLRPFMDTAIDDWGSNKGQLLITKVGKGIKRDSFTMTGSLEQEISKLTVAIHRLYAIQGAATSLREGYFSDQTAPFAKLVGLELNDAVKIVRDEFKVGWGVITVLHLLTDFGLACKPDLHLVRACEEIGIIEKNSIKGQIPTLQESLKLVKALQELDIQINNGTSTPQTLRRLDKTLMEISRSLLKLK